MIFAVLGTHTQPFPRALELLTEVAASESVTVQVGHTARIDHQNITCREYLQYGEVAELMRAARAVVCHAGVGTILTAVEAGHRPVVIPRLRQFHEHVDDHQLGLALALETQDTAYCYRPGDSLSALIEASASSTGSGKVSCPSRLGDAVRDEVWRACGSADLPGLMFTG